jgi:hypothetical protein
MRESQKFTRGDVVRVADDLGSTMSHFRSGADAIVMGSYRDQYGGSDAKNYTLMFCDDGNRVSWYYEYQLTLIRHGGQRERRKRRTCCGSLRTGRDSRQPANIPAQASPN